MQVHIIDINVPAEINEYPLLRFQDIKDTKTWNNKTVPTLSRRRQIWWNLAISNPKPEVHNINAHTKFGDDQLIFI